MNGKVLENRKRVRRNKNVGKMWGSNCIKLVFGPGASKSGLRCKQLFQQGQKVLRSKFGVKILVLGAKHVMNQKPVRC